VFVAPVNPSAEIARKSFVPFLANIEKV